MMMTRPLLIWLLILWLPAQALAGQMSLCTHNGESDSHAHHHSHTEPHAHPVIPTASAHDDCPHCSHHLSGQNVSTDQANMDELFCDHCNCCQLGGAYASFIHPLNTSFIYRDDWPSTMAVTIHSHISHPLQRPPQHAA
jgi:hypothetical protein